MASKYQNRFNPPRAVDASPVSDIQQAAQAFKEHLRLASREEEEEEDEKYIDEEEEEEEEEEYDGNDEEYDYDKESAAELNSDGSNPNIDEDLCSYSYVPREFLGMKTETLGFHISGQDVSPFLQLKNKIISEGSQIDVQDRMQAVRYLCNIPYTNHVLHCVEAALPIVKDESIDVYKRYYFFDNKDKYFRLDDHVVQFLHPAFFKYGLKVGCAKVPFELLLHSAEYIFKFYGAETIVRQQALDWCLDQVEDDTQDIAVKVNIIKLLLHLGQEDEKAFASEQLEILGLADVEDFELSDREKLCHDLLRALQTTYTLSEDDTPQGLFTQLVQYVNQTIVSSTVSTNKGGMKTSKSKKDKKATNEEASKTEALNKVQQFFEDVIHSEQQIQSIPSSQIAILLFKFLTSSASITPLVRQEVYKRLYEVVLMSSTSEITTSVVELVCTLENFCTPRVFQLKPTVEERLRNDLFAALNKALHDMPERMRKEVQTSRKSQDKAPVREFLRFFDDEKDCLQEDYKNDCSVKEFETLYQKITNEWMN
jgi:hypothetical protein